MNAAGGLVRFENDLAAPVLYDVFVGQVCKRICDTRMIGDLSKAR
jgi:hypothetical protein